MALSTCPKPGCDSHRFELVEADVQNARFKMYFVQCQGCGAVLATQPYQNTNVMVEGVQRQIKEVDNKLAWLTTTLTNIANRLR